MRVLVTGGSGFIGSFVSERFHQGGHDVSNIDNLSTGDHANLNHTPKLYCLNVEDPGCEEVFRNGQFDVVIHLAAQVDIRKSMEQPVTDVQSNIVGLVNMLQLSAAYKVKKFIFASSAAVYGDQDIVPLKETLQAQPQSIYGFNKLIGEHYCQKWSELYGLDTLCIRFSNVYGPRQGHKGEGGVVSIFHEAALQGRPLIVYGDGQQTRDFIYVTDIAECIYKASANPLKGVCNASTNCEIKIQQLVDLLRNQHPDLQVQYVDARAADIYRSCLDNSLVKQKLGWEPVHSFEEGFRKTYDWFLGSRSGV
jgi:UDP-glucuronate decarboxylase